MGFEIETIRNIIGKHIYLLISLILHKNLFVVYFKRFSFCFKRHSVTKDRFLYELHIPICLYQIFSVRFSILRLRFLGFAHALFNFSTYAGFLVTLYIHTMSAFVDNILQCFIFNSSLATAEKGWGWWVAVGCFGGGDGGLVSLTLSACQAENARPKGSKNELKKKQPPLIRDNTFA